MDASCGARLLRRGFPVLCAGFLLLSFAGGARAASGLFGSVEFRMGLAGQDRWLSAMERHRRSPLSIDGERLRRSPLIRELRSGGLSFLDRLKRVNAFWNRQPWRSDDEAYGTADHWASPREFLQMSGDCEDYCIAKYYTLRELGVPAADMRIVVVRDTIRRLVHAVLAVQAGSEIYVLDNLADSVRPARRVRNYVPQFSVNEEFRWVHVMPKEKAASPGERSTGDGPTR